ncbi:unnamed protein product [Lactuca saligna]|uniref:Uncharacterized protein n=1 Tax=Lactuca saligna TaxID=75948 RepID=A0AA35VF96_LACSI|nr:unnamed protein product [Lactuca saligna]
MTKEHQANMDKVNQAVSDSTAMCKGVIDKVRTDLQTDNIELRTSISSTIDKLRADLAVENGIMDELIVNNESPSSSFQTRPHKQRDQGD